MSLKKMGPALGLAALAACGGDPATAPTESPGVMTLPVAAQQGAQVTALSFSHGATAEVTADWGVVANDLDVYVTAADCIDIPSALSAFSCLTVAEAAGPAAKPERLTFPVAAGSAYKVFVINRGSQADTVRVTIAFR